MQGVKSVAQSITDYSEFAQSSSSFVIFGYLQRRTSDPQRLVTAKIASPLNQSLLGAPRNSSRTNHSFIFMRHCSQFRQ
jgi:hypothetical protein